MSLLTIVQDTCRRLSLTVPTAVVASVDPNVTQIYGLLNQLGKDLVRAHPWQRLTKEKTITTTATETQTGAIPTDFSYFIPDSVFNRTRTRRVMGPLTAHEWQAEKAILASVLFDAFRVRGNNFIVTPVPPAGETWAYEYISTYWVDTDADGTGDATAFSMDADTTLLSEELLVLGAIWRFRQAKGLDYAEPFRDYQMAFLDAAGRDGGKRTLDMSGARPRGARIPYVSEGSWPL